MADDNSEMSETVYIRSNIKHIIDKYFSNLSNYEREVITNDILIFIYNAPITKIKYINFKERNDSLYDELIYFVEDDKIMSHIMKYLEDLSSSLRDTLEKEYKVSKSNFFDTLYKFDSEREYKSDSYCEELCKKALSVIHNKYGITPNNLKKISKSEEKNIFTYFGYGDVLSKIKKDLSEVIKSDILDSIVRVSINKDFECKFPENGLLFCVISSKFPSGSHANFAILDKTNKKVYFYEPHGLNFLYKFYSVKEVKDQYSNFLKKCFETDEIEYSPENFIYNSRFSGLQSISGNDPLCIFFSYFQMIIVLIMYQLADDNIKRSFESYTKCIEEYILRTIKKNRLRQYILNVAHSMM